MAHPDERQALPDAEKSDPSDLSEKIGPAETTEANSAGSDTVPDQQEVIDAICTVYDPEIPVNVYELGLIYTIDLHDDGRVEIEMSLTAPNCPSAQELPEMIRYAVLSVASVKQVEVRVVWEPPWDMSRMSDEARLALNMF